MYLDGEIVLQTTINLLTNQWYLARPSSGRMIADRLSIQGGVDIDNLIFKWGQMLPTNEARQK
jgi:hypothetical protein